MTKVGVVVLATPDLGGTYQYSLSMLEALRHTQLQLVAAACGTHTIASLVGDDPQHP